MQNGTRSLLDIAASYETQHILLIRFSDHAPWYLPKWLENLHPHKNLPGSVYSSFIHFGQNLEETKCPWVDGWPINCGTSGNEIVFRAEKKWALKPSTTWGKLKRTLTTWKKLTWEGDVCAVWFQISDALEKAQLWRQWNQHWLPGGVMVGGMSRWSTGKL